MEQRQFSRVDFHTKIFLIHQGQRTEAKLLDISLKGALILIDQVLLIQKGDNATLELQLGESNVVLNINADLMHIHKNNFGFKFTSIDLDSLSHLRRLMEINLGNTDLIDQELFFLSQ